eukprot:COSAG02_NODE_15003_length_1215_cov_1.401434_2_plen_118_part_00
MAMMFSLLHLVVVSSVPVISGSSTLAPQWINGALISGGTEGADAMVCSTSNGCTDSAFLACSDASQTITNITFASYVSIMVQLPPAETQYSSHALKHLCSAFLIATTLNAKYPGQPK